MRAYPNSPRSRAVIQCRGRGSNPHGAFAPEDFKSFDYDEKLFVLLALFRPNVKVCGVDPVSWTVAEWGKWRRAAMPKSHARYAPEYRRRMVELVRAGRSPDDLAKEFEPTAQSIRNWVAQAERDGGGRLDGLTSEERQELTRLRRENRVLREEREILSKAAAWFATETGSVPSRRSNS